MGIRFREADREDLGGILALYTHLHAQDMPLPGSEMVDQVWNEILANPLVHPFLLDVDGALVSSCILAIIPNLTRGARPYGLVENVVTDEAYRRQGYARQLLLRVLAFAWKRGCYKVMLLSSAERAAAHRLYESVGFEGDQKVGYVAKPSEDP